MQCPSLVVDFVQYLRPRLAKARGKGEEFKDRSNCIAACKEIRKREQSFSKPSPMLSRHEEQCLPKEEEGELILN